MNSKLYEHFSRITEEEQAILDGNTEIQKQIYTNEKDFVIDSRKMLQRGKLIDVRHHTRFVHFPKHRHNFVEIIYMYQGTTTHILDNGEKVILEQGDLLFLNQNAEHEILPAGVNDIAINFPLVIVELLLLALVNGLFFIFTVYTSIAIGHLFSKHKVAWAIVAYFLIDVAIQLITGITAIPVAESISIGGVTDLINFATNQFIPYSLVFTAILTAVFYFVSWYIFKNKLNLE